MSVGVDKLLVVAVGAAVGAVATAAAHRYVARRRETQITHLPLEGTMALRESQEGMREMQEGVGTAARNVGNAGHGILGGLRSTVAGKVALSMAAITAVGGLGAIGTGATFNDQVTMAQITVTGGTLDVVANSDAGDSNVAWSGTFDVSNMQPGQVETADVSIDNAGSLPYSITGSINGASATACYGLYFRETAVTSGSGAAAWPVNLTGAGTGTGNAQVVAITSDPTGFALPDNGADVAWEVDDTKTYQLSIRMMDACTTNGATGTIDVTFDATQV